MFARLLAALAAACVLGVGSGVAHAQEKKILILKSIEESNHCNREIKNELVVGARTVSLRALDADSSHFTYEAPINADGSFDKVIRNIINNNYRLQGSLKTREISISLISGQHCSICKCTWTARF